MHTRDYRKRVLATEAADWDAVRARLRDDRHLRILHAAIGLASEVGELSEAILVISPSYVSVIEELGDALWYCTAGLDAADGALALSPLSDNAAPIEEVDDWRESRPLLELLVFEAGEILSQVKAWIYYGRDLDLGRLRVRFDMAVHYLRIVGARHKIDITDIMEANVRKLHGKRYKGGVFSEEAANNRDLEAERETLEHKST